MTTPRQARPRLRTRALELALGAGSIVAGFVVAELALRTLAPQATTYAGRGLYAADDELGHVLRPHVAADGVRTNSLGLRDREYPLARRPGTYRILGLGDSHTFGSTDPDGIFLELLEMRFSDAPLPVEVVNAGVPGYSTLQEVGLYGRIGRLLRPDLVVLALFVTGDVIENRSDAFAVVQDGELTSRYVPRWRRWMFRWHLFRWLRARSVVRADAARDAFLAVEKDRVQVCRRRPSRYITEGFARTRQAVLDLRDRAKQDGAELLVMVVPDECQVDRRLFAEAIAARGERLEDFEHDLPNRTLSAMLAEAGIDGLDLLPALRARAAISPVYRPLDTHWNEDGHALAAERLHEALRPRIARAAEGVTAR